MKYFVKWEGHVAPRDSTGIATFKVGDRLYRIPLLAFSECLTVDNLLCAAAAAETAGILSQLKLWANSVQSEPPKNESV